MNKGPNLNAADSYEGDEIEQLLEGASTLAQSMTIDLFGQERSLKNFALLVSNAFEMAELINREIVRLVKPSKDLACGAGCSHCCSKIKVVTQPMFALYALFYARGQSSSRVHAHVLRKLKAKETDCQFLRAGECSIYLGRPLVCRLFHSFDYNECLNFNFERTVRTETMGEVAVFAGVTQALKDMSIDCEDIFLSEALGLLTTTSGVFEKWAAGSDVFAPCRLNKEQLAENDFSATKVTLRTSEHLF